MRVFLSISAQLCCKIKAVYLWVHLNVRPTFVIVENLSCPYLLQDTTNNHASGSIVVNINFPQPGFIGSFKESWVYMPLFLLPVWFNVKLCLSHITISLFLNDFQDEISHDYPMIFPDWYMIGSISNPFPITSIS